MKRVDFLRDSSAHRTAATVEVDFFDSRNTACWLGSRLDRLAAFRFNSARRNGSGSTLSFVCRIAEYIDVECGTWVTPDGGSKNTTLPLEPAHREHTGGSLQPDRNGDTPMKTRVTYSSFRLQRVWRCSAQHGRTPAGAQTPVSLTDEETGQMSNELVITCQPYS